MLVPVCDKCGNRKLLIGPKATDNDDLRVYCQECNLFYKLTYDVDLNLPVLTWIQQ